MKIAAGVLAFAATLLFAAPARAQDNKEELKRKILDEISKKLDVEMKRILEEISKLIDDEFAKARGAKPSAPAAPGKSGFLGVRSDPNDQPDADEFKAWGVDGGVRIMTVEGAPAEKAGLKDGDVITEVNGTKIKEMAELPASLKSSKPGDKATIKFFRGKEAKELTVTLGERPEAPAPPPGPRDPALDDHKKSTERPGRLGISPGDATGKGMAIDSVSADTPAATAGIKAGDVLVKLDETPIWKESDLEAFMKKAKAGQKVEITILRGGEEKKFSVVLAER